MNCRGPDASEGKLGNSHRSYQASIRSSCERSFHTSEEQELKRGDLEHTRRYHSARDSSLELQVCASGELISAQPDLKQTSLGSVLA